MELKNMEEYYNKIINSLKEWVRGLVQYAITTIPDTSGYDQVEGRAVGPRDPAYQLGVRRFGNYGFRSLPPKGSEAILVNVNGALGNKAEIASENIAYGPSIDPKSTLTNNFAPLQEGEVSIFSKFKALLRLKTNGNLTLNSGETSTGTPSDIVLNDGVHKIARVNDTVDCGSISITPVVITGTANFWYYPPGGGTKYLIGTLISPMLTGSGTPLNDSGLPLIPVNGVITSGADHALA